MSIHHVRFSGSITIDGKLPGSEPDHGPEPGPEPEHGPALRDKFEWLIEDAIRIAETLSGVEFERAVHGFAARLGRELLLPASVPFECGYNLGAVQKITSTADGIAIQCEHAYLWLARGSAVYGAKDEPKAGNEGGH